MARWANILGLMVALSFMLSILASWLAASYLGAVYYKIGEPNYIIKYVEWILGLISGGVLITMLTEELSRKAQRS